jgi:hypothetical protein
LLNGKGEITDVSLNCSFINEALSKISPYVEFEEIHVSRLGFHVTAWANLRKAPIVVDIGVITATIQEPLHCLPKSQRKRLRILTERELVQLLLDGVYKPLRGNGSYGFIDRIVDNLTIEIQAFNVSFQTWGKFKTRRIGPWTPPRIQLECAHLKIVSVDPNGNEGTPDQVWAHNRLGDKTFLSYKKVSGEISVSITSSNETRQTVKLINGMKLEVQAAIKRRLRDGAVLSIQADVTIPTVEVDLDPDSIPLLAHLAAGMQYCFAKDRSFEDPLRPQSEDTPSKQSAASNSKTYNNSYSQGSTDLEEELDEGEDEEDDEDDQGPETNDIVEDAADSSSSEDHDDENENDIREDLQVKQSDSQGSVPPDAPYKRRPIILLPNGLVIYENVCFTCSVHNITVRGSYGSKQKGYVQLSTKGCITEIIWPKNNDEFGLYAQASVSYLSLQERLGQRMRSLLIGGIWHGDHPSLHKPAKKPREIGVDENFPLFERRSVRDDPLDLRHSFPAQAFGLKTTIDPHQDGDQVMFLHEVGMDEFDIVLDADAWCRAVRFSLNEDGGGFDDRWQSGDWTDLLTQDMLHHPSTPLTLDDHLQPAKQILLDENALISSDLFNVTARLTNIELRMPAAVQENVRSCDILVELKETMFVVSSALPRTFLSGKIGNSISGDALRDKGIIDFPNDPSDLAYAMEQTEDPSLRLSGVSISRTISTFRVQLTMRGLQIRTVPIIPFCNAPETQQLIAPTDLTMIICFEGEPPELGSNYIKIALFVSIQIHRLLLNIDFDLLASATSTALYHSDVVEATIERAKELIPSAASPSDVDANALDEGAASKVKKSLRGRRVMVRRHLSQSRETGGLGIVFCLQQSELGITIWRQNVPFASPLRHKQATDSSRGWDDSHVRILKLVDVSIKDFEIGVEFDFRAKESQRTVLKCCLEKATVQVCDVEKEMAFRCAQVDDVLDSDPADDATPESNDKVSAWHMVDLVSFGVENLPGNLRSSYSGQEQHFALRLEEQIKGSRSWSLAADLTSPATINLCVDEVKQTGVLLIEALLSPTWSKREFPTEEGAPFPDRTIGAMFHALLSAKKGTPQAVQLKWDKVPENGKASSDPYVERALRTIFKLLLPADLRLVLLRLEIANLLISIPHGIETQDARSLGLLLNRSDLVVRFYPVPGSQPSDMEDVLACKGIAWSSLIDTKEEGYYQSISSRQSMLALSAVEGGSGVEILVHPFDIGLTYAAAQVKLSMDNSVMVNDIRRIEGFFDGVKSLGDRCTSYQLELGALLSAIRQPTSATSPNVLEDSSTLDEKEEKGELSWGKDVTDNTTSTRSLIQRVHEELALYENDLRRVLNQKDAEAESLKIQVFEKEKDRFAALALMSSRVAGWIRMGGVHGTGQRVARKSTMWPYWAVLRKDLLILYASPGEVSFGIRLIGFPTSCADHYSCIAETLRRSSFSRCQDT